MHHFVTEMCTHMLQNVALRVYVWCIVGFLRWIYCITMSSVNRGRAARSAVCQSKHGGTEATPPRTWNLFWARKHGYRSQPCICHVYLTHCCFWRRFQPSMAYSRCDYWLCLICGGKGCFLVSLKFSRVMLHTDFSNTGSDGYMPL